MYVGIGGLLHIMLPWERPTRFMANSKWTLFLLNLLLCFQHVALGLLTSDLLSTCWKPTQTAPVVQ
jgi:hypothetical protein